MQPYLLDLTSHCSFSFWNSKVLGILLCQLLFGGVGFGALFLWKETRRKEFILFSTYCESSQTLAQIGCEVGMCGRLFKALMDTVLSSLLQLRLLEQGLGPFQPQPLSFPGILKEPFYLSPLRNYCSDPSIIRTTGQVFPSLAAVSVITKKGCLLASKFTFVLFCV